MTKCRIYIDCETCFMRNTADDMKQNKQARIFVINNYKGDTDHEEI